MSLLEQKTISFILNKKGVKHDLKQKELNLLFKDNISSFDYLELKKKIPELLDFIKNQNNGLKIKKT